VSINSLLEYDDFRHVESEYSLVGRRSGRQFRMGDKVTIKVVAASLAKRQLDYEWVITAAEKDAEGELGGGVARARPAGRTGQRHPAHRKQGRQPAKTGQPGRSSQKPRRKKKK
jgi:ribonuclease R